MSTETKPICGAHSRAYRADCVLPIGHDGDQCETANGDRFFSSPSARPPITRPPQPLKERPKSATLEWNLQKLRVLQAIAEGYTDTEIAHRVSLSPHTVKYYASEIFEQLHCESRTAAAVIAIKQGILNPADLLPKRRPPK